MSERSYRADEVQEAVQEIAEVLLRQHPPGTRAADVWGEALTLYRVRFEHRILLEDGSYGGEV
jgi:hypothetical protein